jgi:DNA repair protein RadC
MTTLHTSTTDGYREATSEEILAAANAALARKFRRGVTLDSPSATHRYLTHRLADRHHEVFTVLFLDNSYRLISCDEMFRGTIDGASVHPREVVKQAQHHNAAAVILAHFVAQHKMSLMCL